MARLSQLNHTKSAMDLKDFVANSLTQIVEGVAAAGAAVNRIGGAVSPDFTATGPANGDYLGRTRDGNNNGVYSVSFDVAVTVGGSDGTEGGGKLQVAGVFSLGGKASSSAKEETVSRLKFLVPLALPIDPASRAATEEQERKAAADAAETDRKLREYNRSPFAG